MTLSNETLAIEGLNAQFERKAVTGRLVYGFAAGKSPARLEAELNAPELDVDAAIGFGKALIAGSNLERPHDMTIAADIGRASIAGIEAGQTSVRLKVDGDGLQLDRLSVADLGGGAFSASGRIDTGGHTPRGALTLDFEARQTGAIAALIAKFAPKSADPAIGLVDRVGHAKLHATLDVADGKDGAATVAQLAVKGDLDAMHLDAGARMSGDWAKPAAADIRLDATIDAPDGAALIKLVGLDRLVAAGNGPGQFKVTVAGPADRDLNVDAHLSADGLSAEGAGRGRVSLDQGASMTATLQVAKANLRPLRPAGDGAPLPARLNTRLTVAGRKMKFDDIDAKLGASNIRGRLAVDAAGPIRIDGTLDADTADAAELVAGAIGMPAPLPASSPSPAAPNAAAWTWSSEPFAGGAFADLAGTVVLKATRVDITPRLAAREFRAALHFGKDAVSLDEMTGEVAGGKLNGTLAFSSDLDGLAAHGKVMLAGADAAVLLPAAARPPVTGALDLVADIEGVGLSPAALIGSLHGNGKLTLANGHFAGLDPRAFDAVTAAVDKGLTIDTDKIAGVVRKALESGALSVKQAEGSIVVSAGQVRLSEATAHSEDADVSLAGNLDLTDGTVDARLVLSGVRQAGGARPDIFMSLKGPLPQPTAAVDVSALTGWLTLRAIESQSRKLQELEKQRALEAAKQSAIAVPPAVQGGQAPAPESEPAPALPAPVDIRPLPIPLQPAKPGASVDPQH